MKRKKNTVSRVINLVVLAFILVLSCQKKVDTETEKVGSIEAQIVDADNGESLRVRAYVTGSDGRPVFDSSGIQYSNARFPFPEHHFTTRSGSFRVLVPAGRTILEIHQGLEYVPISDTLEVKASQIVKKNYRLHRWINMAEQGWFSGDFHIHRPLKDLKDLILAEDLNVALPQTIWNNRSDSLLSEFLPKADSDGVIYADPTHIFTVLGEEIERYGGAILLTGLKKNPISFGDWNPRTPTDVSLIRKVHAKGGYVDIEKPFWREACVNAAVGKADFIEVIHNHINHPGCFNNPAWGWSRNTYKSDYPEDIMGLVLFSLDIYYGLLNSGLHLSPTAGTASGVLPNPVGYNRVYVHTGKSFSLDSWFTNLKAGRCFVTNGPMLFLKVNGHEPGEDIILPAQSTYDTEITVDVRSIKPLEYIEIILNGKVIQTLSPVPGPEAYQYRAEVSLPIHQSSWIAVRCFELITPVNVRYAHSAPIFIYLNNKPRPIDPEAIQFFIERINVLMQEATTGEAVYSSDQRFKRILQNIEFNNAAEKEATLSIYQEALQFFQNKLIESHDD